MLKKCQFALFFNILQGATLQCGLTGFSKIYEKALFLEYIFRSMGKGIWTYPEICFDPLRVVGWACDSGSQHVIRVKNGDTFLRPMKRVSSCLYLYLHTQTQEDTK